MALWTLDSLDLLHNMLGSSTRLRSYYPNHKLLLCIVFQQAALKIYTPQLPTAVMVPAVRPATVGYDPNGRDRDCGSFDTHAEAQAFFIAAGGPARDPYRLDGDNDGIACESLP